MQNGVRLLAFKWSYRQMGEVVRKPLMLFAAVTALLAGPIVLATEPDQQLLKKFEKMIPSDALTDQHVLATNGFAVATYNLHELDPELGPDGKLKRDGTVIPTVIVSADGDLRKPFVVVERGRRGKKSVGFAAFDPNSTQSMVTAEDNNGDGRLDYLRYTVLDAAGQPVVEVIDYDMDGQADLRVHYDGKPLEIWHADGWHDVTGKGKKRGIRVHGKFLAVVQCGHRLCVKD